EKDYYQTLNISKNASADDIKKAYRKLAKKWHPDHNNKDPKTAEAKFKTIQTAYEVLSDPTKRSNYDQFGEAEPSRNQGWSNISPDDIFGGFGNFGGFGGFRQQRPSRDRDMQIEVPITLEEVATGVKKKISFPRHNYCKKCNGQGGSKTTCSMCKGDGRVSHRHQMGVTITTCRQCRGAGEQIINICTTCQARGYSKKTHSIDVNVPPGVKTNDGLVAENEGHNENLDLPRGHVICVISVVKHPEFARQGSTIGCSRTISMTDASLGTKIRVPTVWKEKIKLTIPPGTQPGQVLRLKGKGLPSTNSNMIGDQLVEIRIEIPRKLSTQAQQCLREFEKLQLKN
ncbi:hypothetical protein LCGC14_2483880, partial [marine sediment metagenome]